MARLCVNQYDASAASILASDLDTPRCIADWAHTTEQVLIAVALWIFLLLLSTTWTMAARRQRRRLKPDEIGFSLVYRRWARTSRTAAIINRPLQLIVSILIFAFMINRCSSYEVSSVSYYCMTALYIISLLDAGVRFLAARYKVLHCFGPLVILEILMIASHFQVGFGSTKMINGVATRSWLDFSIMRPVFILRSYLEMDKHVPRSARGWMMARLAVKVLLLIVFGASMIFFLETLGEMPFFQDNGFAHLYNCDGGITRNATECGTETWSIMFSFYFTVVTLGTVGYGDNAPKTVLSRLLAIMFIVMGVILFSLEIENLITLYRSRQIGNPPYKPKAESRHVVIMGNPSCAQLMAILRELFHEDHSSTGDDDNKENHGNEPSSGVAGGPRHAGRLHAVVIGERKSKFTKGLVTKLEADPIFAAQVTYVAGNPTKPDDLDRALAREAEAVFVFPDKLSDDPTNEDALNIMRVLATRRHCGPRVRCLVMVLRAESARHMLAAGVHRDDVICENVIKMGTLAQSAMTHGASTMLANLASSLSIDKSPSSRTDENTEASSNGEIQETMSKVLLRRRVQLREVFKNKSLNASDLRLSRLGEQDGDHSTASSTRSWLKEYYEGAAKEMYMVHLSKRYAGMTFSAAARRIFDETSGTIVLIAVEVTFSGANEGLMTSMEFSSDARVLLNPGTSLIMAEWMQCYVIADDLARVFEYRICPDSVTRHDILRPGATPTVLNALVDTFIEPIKTGDDDDEHEGSGSGKKDGFQNVTAYAPLTTPVSSRGRGSGVGSGDGLRRRRGGGGAEEDQGMVEQQSRRRGDREAVGVESVVIDNSLRTVALHYRDHNTVMGNNDLSIIGPRPSTTTGTNDSRRSSLMSTDSAVGHPLGMSRRLEPPPLSVLLHPKHIVVCSFLGEESLASLQWLIVPLRSVHVREFAPITILDASEPSDAVASALFAFRDVYYVRGSPLVYSDLQRAGAKAAATVIVLGKRTKRSDLQRVSTTDGDIESSIIDAEAIFSTMLIELKMDFTKLYTITELADESNSKFMGTSNRFQLVPWQEEGQDDEGRMEEDEVHGMSWWEYLLLNDIPQQKSEKAIFGLPLYMSGRLLHPELCENMLVQTFYNPSIHKIIRQLVGGPRCTGLIQTYALPRTFRQRAAASSDSESFPPVLYKDVFHALMASSYAGMCVGVYRLSTQTRRTGPPVRVRIVLTTPPPDFALVPDDHLFVLVGVHTLARAATCIQRFYRKYGLRTPAIEHQPPLLGLPSPLPTTTRRSSSFMDDPRARIARYLAPKPSDMHNVSVTNAPRRSLIAQESTSSFRSFYV